MPVHEDRRVYPMAERKLERKNAHRHIPYHPSRDGSDSDTELAGQEDLSEEDFMLYGGNSQSLQKIFDMVGPMSITPGEWESGRSRHGSSPLSTTPQSPTLSTPDSGAGHFRSSPSRSPVSPAPRDRRDSLSGRHGSSHVRGSPGAGSPVAPPSHELLAAKGHMDSPSSAHRPSWGQNYQNVDSSVPSTSYDRTVRRQRPSRSGEANPIWMTEGRPETPRSRDFAGFKGTSPREGESPRTPRFKAPWTAEILPDVRDSSPASDRGSRISTRDNGRLRRVPSASEERTIASPRVKEPGMKEIVLSPPRDFDYSSRDRAYTAASLVTSPATRNDLLPSPKPSGTSDTEPQESSVMYDPSRVTSGDPNSTSLPANLDTGGTIPAGSRLSSEESTLTDDPLSTDVDGIGMLQPRTPWRSWQKVGFIGRGSFGTVHEAVSSDGTYFAVKEVPLDKDSGQSITQLEQEIALLSQFRHENIVQYLGTERTDQALYIFLELVSQGSLVSRYKKHKLYEEQIQGYTRQILRGLEYLHDRNIVHRDVKCANILVDPRAKVKLADFGLAKQINKVEELMSSKGSPNWMAPEVFHPGKTYHFPADIWSLGCTVLEMATGAPPFPDLEWFAVYFKVAKGESPPIPEELNEDMKDFIRQCCEADPAKRPTAAQLLEHPFLHAQYRVPPSPSSSLSRKSLGGLNAMAEDMLAMEPNGEATFQLP